MFLFGSYLYVVYGALFVMLTLFSLSFSLCLLCLSIYEGRL